MRLFVHQAVRKLPGALLTAAAVGRAIVGAREEGPAGNWFPGLVRARGSAWTEGAAPPGPLHSVQPPTTSLDTDARRREARLLGPAKIPSRFEDALEAFPVPCQR